MREVRLDPSVGGGPDAAAVAPLHQRHVRGAGWIAVPDPANRDDVLRPGLRARLLAAGVALRLGDQNVIEEDDVVHVRRIDRVLGGEVSAPAVGLIHRVIRILYQLSRVLISVAQGPLKRRYSLAVRNQATRARVNAAGEVDAGGAGTVARHALPAMLDEGSGGEFLMAG